MPDRLAAEAATGRALIQRIERYLDGMERAGRSLGPWETDRLGKVLAYFESGYYRIGMDLMREVEQPDLYRTPKELAAVVKAPVLTVAQQRARLARVLRRLQS